MGANAQTSVPTFTAGDVLTAANMNISARTGVPVFASTVTRDAAFGGTGEKTLAEGQMCYVEGTGFQTYNGTAWVTWGTAPSSGALALVKTQTIGSGVASVQVTDAFNSTYDNYFIWLDGGASSTGQDVNMILGATTTGYYAFAVYGFGNSNSVNGLGTNNGSNWPNAAAGGTNGISAFIYLSNPNLARRTLIRHITSGANGTGFGLFMAGYLDNATQYTAFTLTPNTGTFTGGTIRVYGYVNS